VMHDVVAECLAVARAEGVQVAGDVHAAVVQLADSMPSQFSSTAQDLARGKRSEIDYLNGLIVQPDRGACSIANGVSSRRARCPTKRTQRCRGAPASCGAHSHTE